MPLYGRRLFDLSSQNESDGLFRIEHTGQTFDRADIYEKFLQIYALERWTCECTWRASLTHAEAFQSEVEIRKTLTNLVPEYFYKTIFDVIHHNVKPLEKLAEEVSHVLNQSFVLTEPVQFRKRKRDSEALKGLIERIDDPDEEKQRQSIPMKTLSENVKYSVRLLDDDETIIENVTPAELQRIRSVPNREKLKTFIRSFAIRLGTRVDSPWIFYDDSLINRYKIRSRLSSNIVEQFKKSMTITIDGIVREQERLARKQSIPIVPEVTTDDDQVIILSDDEDLEKIRTTNLVVPSTFLNRLEKTRRERGDDSKCFQRLIVQCARTLNEVQLESFPQDFRQLIEKKIEEIALKDKLSQMTIEEKKVFFQTKIDDSELIQTKSLPQGKSIENSLNLSMKSLGDLLMIEMFLICFDESSKTCRKLVKSSSRNFRRNFRKICQNLLRLLLKDDGEDKSDGEDEVSKDSNNNSQTSDDFEEIYSTKFSQIPINAFSSQELIRLILIKTRQETFLLQRLATIEFDEFSIDEQIETLKIFVETINSNGEFISNFHDDLTRILGDASRERQILLAERREEQNEKKKLKLQNENEEKKLVETFDDDENDLKTILQRRRQMVAVSKELKEKKEQETFHFQVQQRKQNALNRAEQIYQDALENYRRAFRLKPLGFDRFYNRYWLFPGYSQLFIETTTSKWFCFDDESQINELVQSLNDRGVREHHLLVNLKKTLPLIQNELRKVKTTFSSQDEDEDEDDEEENIVEAIRSELEEIESRLRIGSLGGWTKNLDDFHRWQNRLKKANQRNEFADLLIELEETVPEKYSSGIFVQSDKKSLQIWIDDCRNCSTFSRLYVLMMIFENSIQWNKSTIGMKCKICRKKNPDESMIVCDQCSQAFHRQCLKMSRRTSDELWFCPTCRPAKVSKRQQRKDSSLSSSSNEPRCSVCRSDGELFSCHQCELFYHCDCHQPPLRCPPRSNQWLCNACRTDSSKMKKQRRSKRLRRSASTSDQDQSIDDSND